MHVLGIETSCDETGGAVVDDGRLIRSSVVRSSLEEHRAFGGVVPEIAARAHVELIHQVVDMALSQAGCRPGAVDAIAVTRGPGLVGSLLVGVTFARGLGLAWRCPVLGVSHLAAHIYAGAMADGPLSYPCIGLLVSGGHTMLVQADAPDRYVRLSETRDDAAGEAFDKVAAMLGLGYPGGPAIEACAARGRAGALRLPRPTTNDEAGLSLSGLKTAVLYHLAPPAGRGRPYRPALPVRLNDQDAADVAAAFQDAVVDILVTKTLRAVERTGIRRVVVGGGVAANRALQERLSTALAAAGAELRVPPLALCLDNGAMIAGYGGALLASGHVPSGVLDVDPNLELN